MHALMHGPTYTGNALACAAANASLDLFEREPRIAQVATIAAALTEGLAPCRQMPGVGDVRVQGAVGVVELDRIDVPVLLVWGDRDRMVSHQGSRHVLAQVPGARYVELEGCGHCPQLEEPDAFNRELWNFLALVEAGSGATIRTIDLG